MRIDSPSINGVERLTVAGIQITQGTHGFSAGNVLKISSGAYALAQADTVANAEVAGIVYTSDSAGLFTMVSSGYVDGLTGLTANAMHFLSDATAGLLTATEPTTEGSVSKPIFYAISTTAGFFINYRGNQIASTSSYYMSFANANLAAGLLTITHNLGHNYCGVFIADNNNKAIIPDEITFTDANTATVDLSSYGAITGTWRAWVLDIGATNTVPINIDGTFTSPTNTEAPSTLATKTYIDNGNCKGRVSFDGHTGTAVIFESYNVDHITHDGTGQWTIYWTVPFASANYTATFGAGRAGETEVFIYGNAWAAGSLSIQEKAGAASPALYDGYMLNVAVYGEQ